MSLRPLWVCVALAIGACNQAPEPATMTVEPMTLRHEVSAEGVLSASRVTAVSVPRDARGRVRLAWLIPEGTIVEAGQLVASFDDSELLDRLSDGRADLRSTDLEIDKTRADQTRESTEIHADHEVAALELAVAERFKLSDDEVFSRHEIIESRIDGELAAARLDHATFAAETVETSGRAALAILGIKHGEAEQKVELAREGLGSLEVRAPHAGLFLRARDWQHEPIEVGAELWAGQEVGEIPDTAGLEVEAFVLEADAGGLAVGKLASVVVEAHPGKTYTAQISRVDSLAKPRFRGSPVQYFGVTLSFDEPADAWLKPGQRVVARLRLATFENVLAVPRQAVVAADDGYSVYRWSGGELAPVAVVLGTAATGLVTIESGLAAGDVIALDPPSKHAGAVAGGGP